MIGSKPASAARVSRIVAAKKSSSCPSTSSSPDARLSGQRNEAAYARSNLRARLMSSRTPKMDSSKLLSQGFMNSHVDWLLMNGTSANSRTVIGRHPTSLRPFPSIASWSQNTSQASPLYQEKPAGYGQDALEAVGRGCNYSPRKHALSAGSIL